MRPGSSPRAAIENLGNGVRELARQVQRDVFVRRGVGVVIVVCVCCVAAFLAVSILSVAHPFDLDMYEGCIFLPATRIAEGLPVYGRAVTVNPPFVFANYGPVYYVMVAAAIRHVGPAFWPGRLLSLVFVLVTAFLIGHVVKRGQGGYHPGTVAAALYLMMPATWTFGSLQRVDALGGCFSVLAVAAAVSGEAGRPLGRSYAFMLAGMAATLAMLTKQSLLAAGLAVFMTLLVAGRGVEVKWFLAGCIAVIAAFSAWAALTKNTGYLFNQAANAAVPFTLTQLVVQTRIFVQSGSALAALVLAMFVVPMAFARRSGFVERLAVLYLVLAGLMAAASASRIASSTNHFLELGAAVSLCAGLSIRRLQSLEGDGLRLANLLLCVALLVDLALFRVSFVRGRILIPTAKRPLHERLIRDLTLRVPPGEPLIGEYTDAVILSGRPLYFSDLGMYQVGPPYMRSLLTDYLERRRLAGIICAAPASFDGYGLMPGYGYPDPHALGGQNYPGPLLYLRDDLRARSVRGTGP